LDTLFLRESRALERQLGLHRVIFPQFVEDVGERFNKEPG
jgi:hypothetical protein